MTITKQDLPRCATCQHWNQFGNGMGDCATIHLDERIVIDATDDIFGEDATVHGITTEEAFSCINHSELKDE